MNKDEIKTKKDFALYYQSIGLNIIPVGANKISLIKWEVYQNKCSTVEEINRWWGQWPDANIAVVTGKISGLVVLDLDIKHGRTSKEFKIPATVCAHSGNGGEHFFFKYPTNGHIKSGSAISGLGVDIRASGGYVLLSPSINETGGIYEWIVPFESKDDLAEMPEWLKKITVDNANDKKWLSGKDGVSEGLRNDTCASMAGKIISSLDSQLWESLGWELLKVWNQKCSPPLIEKEMRSVWNSIKTKHILNKKEIAPSAKFTSLNDLLNEPEEALNWVVDDLLPMGGISIVVAKPKVGKSTLVRQLALSVARGENFLERSTTKGKVLYVALEEKRGEVRTHFKLLGADGTEELGIYVGSAPEKANVWLESEIKAQHPILIIIDTLFRFIRVQDVSDYAKVTSALDPLLKLARENNTHLMVLHHARKMSGEGSDVTLGSSAIFGTVDTSILLKRTQNGLRTLETQQRYGKDIEETILTFDQTIRVVSLGGSKVEEDTKVIKEAILEFLKPSKEPVLEEEIDNEVEGKTGLKRKALRELVKENQVSRIGAGKKGNPYLYSCFLVSDIYAKQENENVL